MSEQGIAAGFSRLAPFYDAAGMLILGGALQRAQLCFIGEMTWSKALILGGGTGLSLKALLRSQSRGVVCFAEPAPAMLRRARRRVADQPGERVRFVAGGIESIDPSEQFDLVCTHFFLDLFADSSARDLMRRIDRQLLPGGGWHYADFEYPRRGLRRWPSKAFIQSLYAAFRLLCGIEARRLPNCGALFEELGYDMTGQSLRAGGMITTRIYRKPTANID